MVEHGKCTAKGKGSRWTQPVIIDEKEFWNITDISKYCGCSWYKASLIAHEYFAKFPKIFAGKLDMQVMSRLQYPLGVNPGVTEREVNNEY